MVSEKGPELIGLQEIWDELLCRSPDYIKLENDASHPRHVQEGEDESARKRHEYRTAKELERRATMLLRKALTTGKLIAYERLRANSDLRPVSSEHWHNAVLPYEPVLGDESEVRTGCRPTDVSSLINSWYPRPGRTRESAPYAENDRIRVAEMMQVVQSGLNPTHAARAVAPKAQGAGTPSSIEKRLIRAYKKALTDINSA